MGVETSPELFKRIKACVGGEWFAEEADDIDFFYRALSEGFEYAHVRSLDIPPLDNQTFRDWGKFEDWCEDIESGLMWRIVDSDDALFRAAYDQSTPKQFFKSKVKVRSRIVDTLCGNYKENLMYVQIESGDESLFLIYFDDDSWTLGHANSVLVLKSLSYLSKRNGFYPLR
jgi:hypothetical protein